MLLNTCAVSRDNWQSDPLTGAVELIDYVISHRECQARNAQHRRSNKVTQQTNVIRMMFHTWTVTVDYFMLDFMIPVRLPVSDSSAKSV